MKYITVPFPLAGPRPHPPRHQRKHQLARGHVVDLRGECSTSDDCRSGLLPETVL